MTKEEMTPEAYDKLIQSITELLLSKGVKATTMDSIALSLQISKRTLYEIFGSKYDMVVSALTASHERHIAKLKEIFEQSSNVMEGILRAFLFQRDELRKVNLDFFRDMDSMFSGMRKMTADNKHQAVNNFLPCYFKGVKQGYFRENINFTLQGRLLEIQMESLKRMEEHFPHDISLLEAYDSITMNFLRSIATPKGLELLDEVANKNGL